MRGYGKLLDSRVVGVVGVILALPQAIVAVLLLLGLKSLSQILPTSWIPFLPWFLRMGLTCIGVFLVLRLYRTRLVLRLFHPLARFRLAPARRIMTGNERGRSCSALMREEVQVLSMTMGELASRAGLFLWEADFLIRHPDFVVRVDIWEALLDALVLQPQWPGGRYTPEIVKERLKLLALRDQFALTLPDGSKLSANRVESMTVRARRKMLSLIEGKLRGEMKGQSR